MLWVAAYPNLDSSNKIRALVTRAARMDRYACLDGGTRRCDWGRISGTFDPADYNGDLSPPTGEELKSDIYQGIVGGGRGIWMFEWNTGGVADDLSQDIKEIANQFLGPAKLGEVVLAADVPQTVNLEVVSGPTQSPAVDYFHDDGEGTWVNYGSIQYLQKEYQGETYILAVNIAGDNQDNAVTARFGNLAVGVVSTEVLFEGRSIPVTDGSFTDTFEENEVHVYKI